MFQKRIYFVSLTVAVALLCSGCAALHKNVYLPDSYEGTNVVTQWNSNGDYDIKGKTFVLSPADDSIAADDMDFCTFARLVEKSLLFSGAIKANEGQACDMRIMLDYKSCSNSGIKETLPDSKTSPLSSGAYISPTYAYRASMGIITRTTEYDHYVNMYALNWANCESNDTLWSIEAYSLGTSEQLHEVMPFVAYSLRNEYGLSCKGTKKESVFPHDYMFRLYYKNFLNQPNVTDWPECRNSDDDFKVAFVAEYDDETFVCIRKSNGERGYYSFGSSIYLDVDGERFPGTVVNTDYSLGDKVWNEYGTRYFVFRFPVNVAHESVIGMYDEDKRGKKGMEWQDIRLK